MTSETQQKSARPLSPHLQIYKPQMTSMLSILHRLTGVALTVGTLLVIWMLLAAAFGPEAFSNVSEFLKSGLGKFLLFGWSFALYYHLCNGIRHLIWDTGYLMEKDSAKYAGYVVLISAVILTALTWLVVCS